MQVHLKADLQAKLDRWTAQTGRQADELVEEAMAGYFDELSEARAMLDSRYDDLKSGRVQGIDSVMAVRTLREKSKARRAERNP